MSQGRQSVIHGTTPPVADVERWSEALEVPERVARGLRRFYHGLHAPDEAARICDLVKIFEGWRSDVYAFDLETAAQPEGRRPLILKVFQSDDAQERARHEFDQTRRVQEAGLPAPRVFHLGLDDKYFGRAFVIMERMAGKTLRWFAESEDSDQRHHIAQHIEVFCRTTAMIHDQDWRAVVPEIDRAVEIDPFHSISTELLSLLASIKTFKQSDFVPVLNWLGERMIHVPCPRVSIIHRDLHPGNLLVAPDRSISVIDWAAFEIADRRLDLAWTLLLTSAHSEALRQQIIDGYEQATGGPVEHIEYFEVSAYLRRLLQICGNAEELLARASTMTDPGHEQERFCSHVDQVYGLLRDKTRLVVPEVQRLLERVSGGIPIVAEVNDNE